MKSWKCTFHGLPTLPDGEYRGILKTYAVGISDFRGLARILAIGQGQNRRNQDTRKLFRIIDRRQGVIKISEADHDYQHDSADRCDAAQTGGINAQSFGHCRLGQRPPSY